MDDRELDRLFGNGSNSDKEAPEKKNRVPESRPVKKPAENKETVKNGSGKKEPEKMPSEDPVPDKKDKEASEVTDKETDKKPDGDKPDAKGSGKPEEEKKSSGETSGDEEEKSEEKDGESGDGKKEDQKEESEEESEEKSEEESEVSEDKDKEPEGEEKAAGKEERRPRKAPVPDNAQKQKSRQEPDTVGLKELADMIPLSGKSIAAICLALVFVIMVALVMFLPAFRVRNTSVEGNVVLTDQEILKAVGLEYDAHLMSGVSGNIIDILRLDYGKTEQKIKKENPYVEDIRITIKLPSTVDITVKERSKVCYIRTPDGYAALDRDGIVLELSSFDSGRTVRPVICGLNVKYAEMGKPVKIDNMNDYKKSIIVLGAILAADNASVGGDYSMFENTSEVRILPSGYIFLTIYSPSGNLIQIKLNGTESIGDKMAWLLYVFNGEAFDKITVDGALDMTGEEYIFGEYD